MGSTGEAVLILAGKPAISEFWNADAILTTGGRRLFGLFLAFYLCCCVGFFSFKTRNHTTKPTTPIIVPRTA